MKKLIVIMTPISFGGGEQQVSLQLKYLKKFGYEIEVFNLSKSKRFEEELEKFNIPYTTLSDKNLGFSPSLKDYTFHLIINILKVFNSKLRNIEKNSIIWAHGFEAAIFAFLVKKVYKINFSVFTRHSMPNHNISKLKKIIYLKILSSYDLIVSVSCKVNERMKNMYPTLKEKMYSIPNGIELEKFNIKSDIKLKNKLGFRTEDIIGIYVARFTSLKNHEFLIQLIKQVNNQKFKLLLIGDGEEKHNIIQLVNKYNLNNRVKIIGYVEHDKIPFYLKISDFCLFPSKTEGFGMSIIESLASGLPVVMFEDVYLDKFKEGVMIAKNKNDFISITKKLIEDKSFLENKKLKALTVSQNFDIRNVVDNYINLFKKKGLI